MNRPTEWINKFLKNQKTISKKNAVSTGTTVQSAIDKTSFGSFEDTMKTIKHARKYLLLCCISVYSEDMSVS